MSAEKKPGCGAGLDAGGNNQFPIYKYSNSEAESQPTSEAARLAVCFNTWQPFTFVRDRALRVRVNNYGLMIAFAVRHFHTFGITGRVLTHSVTEEDAVVLLRVLDLVVANRQQHSTTRAE